MILGIQYLDDSSEKDMLTTELYEDAYIRTLEWDKKFTDNATGSVFCFEIISCVSDENDKTIGINTLLIYNIQQEKDFAQWWRNLNDGEHPKGIIIYGQ